MAVARRVVREVLTTSGRAEWVDAVELACAEVVTNVVLHAHTDFELTIEVFDDATTVQVRDSSPLMLAQRDYRELATTGRGMALVAALSAEHGVSDIGPEGKTVWFTVTEASAQHSDDDPLAAWDDTAWDVAAEADTAGDDTVREHQPGAGEAAAGTTRAVAEVLPPVVRLLCLPPTLWLAARQHHDALLRELVLYRAEHGGVDVDADLPATDRARAAISTAVVAAVQRAHPLGTAGRVPAAGRPGSLPDVAEPLNVQLRLSADAGPTFRAMQRTLNAGERLARAGLLLARPGLPEIIAVRDWACDQITAQLAGADPTPWPGAQQHEFTITGDDRSTVPACTDWDAAIVRDSAGNVAAADEANRIVAVSRPLADALGWAVDDLVGRRVVTLIPQRLREAHVAGFTRHLTTGEPHALDREFTLPVLRADGTEITANLLIRQTATTTGRAVYLAWIEPVPHTEDQD